MFDARMDTLRREVHHRRRGALEGSRLGREAQAQKRLIKVGERRMTAEVMSTEPKGFVYLSVLKCEILANLAARVLEPFKKGEIVRRRAAR
jgi:hypothetical protein